MHNEYKIIIDLNLKNIKKYFKEKKLNISTEYLDNLFSKVFVEEGIKQNYDYAKIDKENPYKIIISPNIKNVDKAGWINHEMIHIISNNLATVDKTHVGGVIIEQDNNWYGQYLNEAITEYINQEIIHNKYSDYYDRYIDALKHIMNMIGEKTILKAYFTNDLNLIINALCNKTKKDKNSIMDYINSIDYLYDKDDYV